MLRKLSVILIIVAFIGTSSKAQTTTFTSGLLEVEVFVSNPCDGSNNGFIRFTINSSNTGSADLGPIIGPTFPLSNFGTETINVGSSYIWNLDDGGSGLQDGEYRFYVTDGTDEIDRGIFNSADGVFLVDLNPISITATVNTQDNSTCQSPPTGPDGQVEVTITGGSLDLPGGGSLSYTWSSDNGLAGLPLTVNNVTATTSLTVDLLTDLGVTGLPGGQYSITINDDYSVCSASLADASILLADPSPADRSFQNPGTRDVCTGDGTIVTLLSSETPAGGEPDIFYQLQVDGVDVGAAQTGDGSDLTFNLASTDFSDGSLITIVASQGVCTPNTMTDNVVINLVTAATANAGTDQTICSDVTVSLSGAIGGSATSSTWSTSGDGTFDDATSLTAIYTPGAGDVTAGTVTLTLTTDDPAGVCTAGTDDMVVTIEDAATANAGTDQTICSDGTANLSGAIGGSATSSTWSTSGDGTFDDATSLTAIYTPGAGDATAGTVTLTLTTDDPAGVCPAASDDLVLTIEDAATANAGTDQTICSDVTVSLSGAIGGSATSSTWSTSGDGTFDDATSLTAIYTPGAGDATAGTVTLTLTTDDPAGVCTAGTDDMVVTIEDAATANAGTDQTTCSDGTANLSGAIGGSATSSTWSTSGDGTFDDATSPTAIYTPGAGDATAGTVTLTLTTDDPAGVCPAASDDLVLTIEDAATANAGTDQTICSDVTVSLSGAIGGSATSSTWSTSGDGTFDDATSLTAIYTPGAGDVTAGTVTLTLTTDDPAGVCTAGTDDMVVTIEEAAIVSAGADQITCIGGSITLSGSFGGSASTITWATTGDGIFGDTSNPTTSYLPGPNDEANGSVNLVITTNNPSGVCNAASDAMILTIDPSSGATADAGSDQTICSDGTVNLSGVIGGSSTSSTWSTSGDGTFDDATSLTAVYTPGAGDVTAGAITLTLTTDDPPGVCPSASDNLVVTIEPAATANAGSDQTICSNGSIALSGSVGGSAGSGTWSTSGDGTFDDATSLTAEYTPGTNDVTSGSVTLTLTTDDPSGACNAASDAMILTIDPSSGATADAGSDQTICSDGTVNLSGAIGGSATSSTWSTSGDGTFDDATSLTAVYTPGAGDVTAGAVTLTLTTDDPPGVCPSASDNLVVTIEPAATANAGSDQTICSNGSIVLSGSVGGSAGSGTWSTSGDGTFDDVTSLTAEYTPGTNDVTSGSVTLTLTTDDPSGACNAASDAMILTIDPSSGATADAGSDQAICSDGTVNLSGVIGGSATSSTWSTSGDGTFDDATSLTAVYTPGAGDVTAGTVTLTLTTDDPPGVCPSASDNLVVTIEPAAIANAGSDQTICSNGSIVLSGSVGGSAGSGTWSTSGDGTFDDVNSLTAEYTPGTNDVTSGSVTLTLTTDDPSGVCNAASDAMILTIDPSSGATADAGSDQTICSGNTVSLSGAIGGSATSSTWSTSGDGTFDDATSLTAVYTPGAGDVTAGAVTLTLTTDDPAGICTAGTDDMQLTIEEAATANAGSDQTICFNGSVVLSGSVGGSAGSGTWSTSGDGTFDDVNSLTAGYTPGTNDVTSGSVTLTLTTDDPAGNCTFVQDQLVVTILPSSNPSCGGGGTGQCATVVISFPTGYITPATCTNSDGEVIFRINPFVPAVNNVGVIIDINGPVSRTNVNDSIFSNLPIGVYDYTIQYGDPSCTITGTVTVDQSGTIGTPVASNIVGPECFGGNGVLNLDVPGETGNNLEWSLDGVIWNSFVAGSQISVPVGPEPTFEQVIAVRRDNTDPCNAAITVVMQSQFDELELSTSTSDASCDNNDGSITVNSVSGGSGDYDFRLDGIFHDELPTNNTFENLAGDNHVLTVIDAGAGGCEKDFNIIVPYPGLVDFTTTVKDPDCTNNSASNGEIELNISSIGQFQVGISTDQTTDPTEFFNVASNGSGSFTFSDLTKGDYYVTVVSTGATCPNRRKVTIAAGPTAVSFDYEIGCVTGGQNKELLLTNITGDNTAQYTLRVFDKLTTDMLDEITFTLNSGQQFLVQNRTFLNFNKEFNLRLVQEQIACPGTEIVFDHPESLVVPTALYAEIGETTSSLPDRFTGTMQIHKFSGGQPAYLTRIELDSAAVPGQSYITDYDTVRVNSNFEYEIVYEEIPAGRYLVEIMDEFGCVIERVARVELNTSVFIPNVFTPNNDGHNDFFFVRNLPDFGAELVITNRWGNVVYKKKDYQNDWTAEGVPDGIYFFKLDVAGEIYNGWVEILRGQP